MNGSMRSRSYHVDDHGKGDNHEPRYSDPVDFDSPETEEVARAYLELYVLGGALGLGPVDGGTRSDAFDMVATYTLPFSDTRSLKFRQNHDRIPIYGSAVTVELDGHNRLVALNASVAPPFTIYTDIDMPESPIGPRDAVSILLTRSGTLCVGKSEPELYCYHDRPIDRWRLVYRVESVEVISGDTDASHPMPIDVYDCLVDAYSGRIVAELPRNHFAGGPPPGGEDGEPAVESAHDELGNIREITITRYPEKSVLRDRARSVHTHDFHYRSLSTHAGHLPGDVATSPPAPWNPAAVAAHANLAEVAAFLKDVLGRDGLDGNGNHFTATINCAYREDNHEWPNAAWMGSRQQLVFGQVNVEGGYRSFAAAKEIVAHEMFHGIIDHTARLEYIGQSGALNESYCDIFGIIIANASNSDIGTWEWELGRALGNPTRSLKEPGKYGVTIQGEIHQPPEHMDHYIQLPITRDTDWGGVHINSGIHNRAACNILTATDRGEYLFDGAIVARIFYKALVDGTYERATFAESRTQVETAAKTLLRGDSRRREKLKAIADAFDSVGITIP